MSDISPVHTSFSSVRRAHRRTIVLRSWRWALVIYGIALTIGTHWPRLTLSPEIPATDKTIHLLAFGVLTVLLWRSGMCGPRWLVALIAIAWAVLDEVSQGIPGLGRTVTWHDLIANICGVTCAMAMIWAMGPFDRDERLAGPSESRMRLFGFAFDEMFARPRPWLVAGLLGGASAAVILAIRPIMPSTRSVGIVSLIVLIVALHVLYLVYRRMFFHELAAVRRRMPCLACGAALDTRLGDQDSAMQCHQCAARWQPADFALHERPTLSALLRISIVPGIVACVGLAMLFAAVLLLPHVYGWSISTPSGRSTAPRVAQMFGRMPREVTRLVDLTIYVLLIAVVVRMWRRRLSAYVDRAVRCSACGHDLHGTPVNEHGEGRCSECGRSFSRAAPVVG